MSSPSQPPVVVVVPTFNERENLPDLVRAIAEHGYAALVVDDASPDGTGEEADRLAAELPNVQVLHRPRREGLGPAYSAGFAQALDGGFEIICQMDADFSHDPTALPQIVAQVASGEADLAIGTRYIPGGTTPDWPAQRRLLSRWGNRYAGFMLGLDAVDATSGYRAHGRDALQSLESGSCRAVGYLFQIEMVSRATRLRLRIAEVPIAFRDRRRGDSKMSLPIIVEAMWLITAWGLARRFGRR